MMRRLILLRRLGRDQRANVIIEFALAGPFFLLLVMGLFDYSWQMYANQVLQGAVANAARDSTLEINAGNQVAIDNNVKQQVQNVFKDAALTFERKAYESFDQIGDPEVAVPNETGYCFDDLNNNGTLDDDVGSDGNGSAEDVVLYTVKMKFDRILPVWHMLGQPKETTLTATSVLRNQPYGANTSTSKNICVTT
ncbi:TadE/TadG family type IV pilus assembly protein [Sphingopyxis sp. H115]|uniref:TadE/TadG family type IV pilus assembly protein n=1 Tax=Sphingopyxis sp. H115 TaxID=1759073 RepID=UPI000736747C|nr:TadE family protein [Sphingopyxis sp. H115]KTE05988.1 pilus assembly protein TadE [Sphingopyxis sp. H115]